MIFVLVIPGPAGITDVLKLWLWYAIFCCDTISVEFLEGDVQLDCR